MSYTKFYDKQFIKTSNDKYIPIILVGSNNCFDYHYGRGRMRASRDWNYLSYYLINGSINIGKDELISFVKNELQSQRELIQNGIKDTDSYHTYEDLENLENKFGYYTSLAVGGGRPTDTSFSKYLNFIKSGIKKALTIEELKNIGLNVRVHVKDENESKKILINSESELLSIIKNPSNILDISFTSHEKDVSRILERYRKSLRPEKTRKEKQLVNEYYILIDNHNRTLVRYTSRGFKYGNSLDYGKKFKTKKQAEAYLRDCIKKGRHLAESWNVRKVDKPYKF